jgi:undecaprenyl-diphosphatase
MIRAIRRLDEWAMERVPDRPRPWSELVGIALSGWTLFPFSLLVFLLVDRRIGLKMLEALVVSMASSEVLKLIVARERPERSGRRPWGYSFPSTHTARVASLIPVAFDASAWAGAVVAGLTVLVGVARVASRAHYPSDVLAGFLLGLLAGCLVA